MKALQYATLALALLISGAAYAQSVPKDGPVYMEEVTGETALWVDLGGASGWLTDRDPLASFTPVTLGIGVAHRVGPARLSWRLQYLLGLGEEPLGFLYLDLLSVERVYGEGTWRPFWRVAVGVGVDLKGAKDDRDFGTEKYFNADNGPSGGLGLTGGGGVDVLLGGGAFLRPEADLRYHGGVGQSGVLYSGRLALGYLF